MSFFTSILFFIIAVVIVFFVPGRLLFALFGRGCVECSDNRQENRFSVERVAATLALGIVFVGTVGMLLVGIETFNVVVLIAAVYALPLIGLSFNRFAGSRSILFNWKEPLFVVLGLGVLFVLLGKPYEWLIAGGWDAGNYNNIASQMLHTGGVLDYKLPHLIFPSIISEGQWHPVISNLYESEDPFIYPRYYHLFSVYIAIFGKFAGMYHAQYVNAFFGFCALLTFYLICRQAGLSLLLSIFGTLLLLVTGIEFHYIKEVYSEMCAQYLFLTSMYYLMVGLRRNRSRSVYLSAFLFNALLLAKMDAVLVWQFFIVVTGLQLFLQQIEASFARNIFRFTATLIPLFLLNSLYAWFYTHPYLLQIGALMRKSLGIRLSAETFLAFYAGAMAIGLAAVSVLSFLLSRQPLGFVGRMFASIKGITTSKPFFLALRIMGVAAVCFGMIYLFCIRPQGYEAAQAAGSRDAYKLISSIRLLYIFPLVFVLFFAFSIVVIFIKKLRPWNTPAVMLPLLSFFYYMVNISHQNLVVIWTYRRLVPAVVPLLVFGVVFFIHLWIEWSAGRPNPLRTVFRGISVAAAIVSVTMVLIHLAPFWGYTENEGIYENMREVAEQIPSDVPLLMQKGRDTNITCSTLKFIFRKQCIVVRDRAFVSVVNRAIGENKEAWIANVSKKMLNSLKKRFKIEAVHRWRFDSPWLRGDRNLSEDASISWVYPGRFLLSTQRRRVYLYRAVSK